MMDDNIYLIGGEGMFLERGGVNLFYEEKGQGDKALILVHGLMMTGEVWKNQVPVFAENFRVITLDLRGFGRSDKPEEAYNFEIFAEDIHAVIQEAGVDQPIFIGWSMGVSVGIVYASRYPDDLSKLVLVDGTPLFVATNDFPHGVPPEAAAQLVQVLQTDFSVGAQHFVELMFPEPGTEDLKEWIYALTQKSPQQSALNCLASAGNRDLRPLQDEISVPTLVVCGGEDQVCMPEASRVMSKQLGNASLHVFPGKGHAPFLTDTEAFNRVVGDFCKTD